VMLYATLDVVVLAGIGEHPGSVPGLRVTLSGGRSRDALRRDGLDAAFGAAVFVVLLQIGGPEDGESPAMRLLDVCLIGRPLSRGSRRHGGACRCSTTTWGPLPGVLL
jgi:hypothetical protein